MPLIAITANDGHKRWSYIDWFKKFVISDTGRVTGTYIELKFPEATDEGLPYEGYYEINAFIICQEWDASVPPVRLPQYFPQTLEVKGSGESYFTIDVSHHYAQGVGTNVSIYNNSLQGSGIIYVTMDTTCSDKKAYIKFTGPQVGTASVQISAGYVTLKYLGKTPGGICED